MNLVERRVEVYSDRAGWAESGEYRTADQYAQPDEVPVVVGGKELERVRVATILP